MDTFEFVVPVAWPSLPYAEGTSPTAWLGTDKKPIQQLDPLEMPDGSKRCAARFKFHLFPTMQQVIKIERQIDELNGGIGETVDLQLAIDQQYAAMSRSYEAELWPDGRPKPADNVEAAAQELLLDAMFQGDRKERAVLDRLTRLRDRHRMCAEWRTLKISVPSGFDDIATLAAPIAVQEAIVSAYTRAKLEAEAAAGK